MPKRQPVLSAQSFVAKLIDCVEHGPKEVVGWGPTGTTFMVHNVKRFSVEVLAHHFKSPKFSSFIRQLNFYGFHKLSGSSKEVWEFQHELFVRGHRELLPGIKRKTSSEYHSAANDEIARLQDLTSRLQGQVDDLRTKLSDANRVIAQLKRSSTAVASSSVVPAVSAAFATIAPAGASPIEEGLPTSRVQKRRRTGPYFASAASTMSSESDESRSTGTVSDSSSISGDDSSSAGMDSQVSSPADNDLVDVNGNNHDDDAFPTADFGWGLAVDELGDLSLSIEDAPLSSSDPVELPTSFAMYSGSTFDLSFANSSGQATTMV